MQYPRSYGGWVNVAVGFKPTHRDSSALVPLATVRSEIRFDAGKAASLRK